jgi:diguanylate cyclase (GGDEF)-like protein/PAS domain S-box-containing protein
MIMTGKEARLNLPVVLIADDDETIRLLSRETLEQAGFSVIEAGDGAAALALFEEVRPDVVLLDVEMPEMDGFTVCASLRRMPAGEHVPVLMMTDLEDITSIHHAYNAGATNFITKPVNQATLGHRVHYILRSNIAMEALRKSEERYALAAKAANNGLWDWDLKTNEVYYSPIWKSLVGLEEGEVGNSPQEWLSRTHPDDLDRLKFEISAHLEGMTSLIEHRHRMLHKDGSYRWMLSRGLAVRDGNGKANRLAGSQTDITDQKHSEEQLLRDALYDPLTSVPNRALLVDRLSHGLKRMRRAGGYVFAVLFMDLDHFKAVNDSLGHFTGDQLLVQIARRLVSCLRQNDTVARLGCDEFVVLLDDIREASNAKIVAERILKELTTPFSIDGKEVSTTASIGIALSSDGYERPEDILRDADIAMYRAKSLGRARFEVFNHSMYVQAMALFQTKTDLRDVIGRRVGAIDTEGSVHSSTSRGYKAVRQTLRPYKRL